MEKKRIACIYIYTSCILVYRGYTCLMEKSFSGSIYLNSLLWLDCSQRRLYSAAVKLMWRVEERRGRDSTKLVRHPTNLWSSHPPCEYKKRKQKNSRVYRLNDPKDKLEKENQNVILYREKKTIENREKKNKKTEKQKNSSWMCLFLSYPIFLIGNWPFFLSFPFCSSFSLLLRVGVCVCQLHSAPVVHVSLKTKQKRFHLFYFFLFSLAILFEFKSISTRKLFPGLLLRPTQPVHPSPPESCNGAAALNCSRRVRLFAPIQSALS